MGNTCTSSTGTSTSISGGGKDLPKNPAVKVKVKSFTYKGGTHQKVPKNTNSVSIKTGVQSIEASTFQYCPSIITVLDIPKSVIVIHSNAFNGCTNLRDIRIPSSVRLIGDRAFHKCMSLSTVHIDPPSSSSSSSSSSPISSSGLNLNSNSNSNSISNSQSLTSTITWPSSSASASTGSSSALLSSSSTMLSPSSSSTTTPPTPPPKTSQMQSFQIGNEAFLDCIKLQKIILPEGLSRIGKYAFYGCTSLSSVTMHPSSTISTIEPSTFANCTSLTTITLPQQKLPQNFTRTSNRNHTSNSSRTRTRTSLRTSLRTSSSLSSSSNLQTISRAAFYKCINLKYINLPPSLTTIDTDAFYSCSSLVQIDVPPSVEHFDMSAFQYCHELQYVNVNANVNANANVNVNVSTSTSTPASSSTSTSTSTALYAFQGCNNLVSICLPPNITSIGMYSFKGCSSLLYAYLPPSITSIGESAFENCISLVSIVLPEGIQLQTEYEHEYENEYAGVGAHMSRIGTNAFRNCKALQGAFLGSQYYNPEGGDGRDGRDDRRRRRHLDNTYNDFLNFLKHRFDGLPLHYDCYRYPHYPKCGSRPSGSGSGSGSNAVVGQRYKPLTTTYQQLRLIVSSYTDPFGAFTIKTISEDGYEMTPLHVLASNPNANMGAIRTFIDALPPCHRIIESTRMKTLYGAFGKPQQQTQTTKSQKASSYSPLQLYMKSRAVSQISLIEALKQGFPWSFIEEIMTSQSRSSLDEILTADEGIHDDEEGDGDDCNQSSSTKGLYPFMISATQRNCDFETTFKLALSSIELLR